MFTQDLEKQKKVKIMREKCVGKTTFYTEEKAFNTAKRAKRDREVFIKPYKCPFCNLYHLTSKQGEKYWKRENKNKKVKNERNERIIFKDKKKMQARRRQEEEQLREALKMVDR